MRWRRYGLMLWLCWLLVGGAAGANETVRIASGEWPPWTGQNLPGKGAFSILVTEAFAHEGVTVEYGFFPWERALSYARRGVWDGSLAWLKTDGRVQDFFFSDPVVRSREVFFHLDGASFDWDRMADLEGLVIGAARGYYYGEAFQQAEANGLFKVVRVHDPQRNFSKLLKQRIDVAVFEADVGYGLLKQYYSDTQASRITHHEKTIHTEALHVILSRKVKGNERLVERFNRGLKALKRQGRLSELLDAVRRGEYLPAR